MTAFPDSAATTADGFTLAAGFVQGSAGALFMVRYGPVERDAGFDVVMVPPFAEEMNRSRRMMALQARALAARGVATLIVDPYGTGDSAGGLADARWGIWRDDLVGVVRDHVAARGHKATLLAVRLGTLLAADAAAALPAVIDRLVLWGPMTSGEAMMTQMLRMLVAAEMARGVTPSATTGGLRGRLRDGEVIEVAGYPLTGDLVASIDAVRLADLAIPGATRVHWIDLVADPAAGPSRASASAIEALRGRVREVRATAITGEAFWTQHDPTIVEALLDATTGLIVGPA